jgi:ligand-binding sensor domain-containing protein
MAILIRFFKTQTLLMSVFWLLTFSSAINSNAQQYSFDNYNVENGFPANVFCVFQDSRGYLWIGTDGQGVCRFDGQKKVFYSKSDGLTGNTVRSIIEDKYNRLWFATDEGISIYNGKYFKNITEKEGLSSNVAYCLFIDNNNDILIGTAGDKGGLNKITIINPDSIKIAIKNRANGLTVNSVFSICQDSWNRYWIGTFGGGINIISSDLKKELKFFNSVEGFPSDYILSLKKFNTNIWVGTYDKGIVKVLLNKDIEKCKIEIIANQLNEGISTVWSVLPIDQSVWYGTNLEGIYKYSDKTFKNISTKNGLSKNQIVNLYYDKENNFWITSFDGGISRFLGERFINYTKEDYSFAEDISSFKTDKNGQIWIGTYSSGLYSLNIKNSDYETKYIGLKGIPIYSIDIAKDNQIWIGTNSGLFQYKNSTFSQFNHTNSGLLNDNINSVFVDKENHVWSGTSKGISVYDGKKFINTKDGYLPNQEIQTIIQDKKGNTWCATLGGLAKFHNDSITTYDEQEGLIHKKINCLAIDYKDNLWIGTIGGGIYKLKIANHKVTIIRIKENESLTSVNINSHSWHR